MFYSAKGNIVLWVLIAVVLATVVGAILLRGGSEDAAPVISEEAATRDAIEAQKATDRSAAVVEAPIAPAKSGVGCEALLTQNEIRSACGSALSFSEKSSLEGVSLTCGRIYSIGEDIFDFTVSAPTNAVIRRQAFEADVASKRELVEATKKFDPSVTPVFAMLSGIGDGAYKHTDGYGMLSVNFVKGQMEGYVMAQENVCGFSGLEDLARKVVGRLP